MINQSFLHTFSSLKYPLQGQQHILIRLKIQNMIYTYPAEHKTIVGQTKNVSGRAIV